MSKMRMVKIVLTTLTILFVEVILLIPINSEFSKWKKLSSFFSVEKIWDLPITHIIPFVQPEMSYDSLMGSNYESSDHPNSKRLRIFSLTERTLKEFRFKKDMLIPKDSTYGRPLYLYNELRSRVFPLLTVEKKVGLLELRDLDGNVLKRNSLEPLTLSIPAGSIIRIIDIADIDADGNLELIWTVSAEFKGLPRGIAVHDLLSGKKKWEFLIGGIPSHVFTKDIDNNGNKEIIFTSWTPHNGHDYNGTNDDTSYIGVLNCNGNLLWMLDAGGFYSRLDLAVGDIDNDGKLDIVTSRHCHRDGNPDPGQIRIYDAITGEIRNSIIDMDVSFENIFVQDVDNDYKQEIISTDNRGKLRLWDCYLKPLAEYKSDSLIKTMGVFNATGQPTPFIFVWSSPNQLQIFDNHLRMVFNFAFPQKDKRIESIVPVIVGKKMSYIMTAGRTYLISSKPSTTFQDNLSLLFSPFSLYLLGLIAFNGLMFLEFKRRKKIKTHYISLMDEMVKKDWLTTVQETLHKMKSPLTAIFWETEKIDEFLEQKKQLRMISVKLRKISKSIVEDVNELKIMNRFLIKFLQVQTVRLQEIKISKLILELINEYRGNLNTNYKFISQLSKKIPTFTADCTQLKELFSVIIDNAVDSMPDGGTITVTTHFHETISHLKKRNILCIEVEDNGCGIPADLLENIFQPYYTTKKEGTGIGLSIAERIVESHEGWIKVTSKKNIGTKFAIFIPIKKLLE